MLVIFAIKNHGKKTSENYLVLRNFAMHNYSEPE